MKLPEPRSSALCFAEELLRDPAWGETSTSPPMVSGIDTRRLLETRRRHPKLLVYLEPSLAGGDLALHRAVEKCIDEREALSFEIQCIEPQDLPFACGRRLLTWIVVECAALGAAQDLLQEHAAALGVFFAGVQSFGLDRGPSLPQPFAARDPAANAIRSPSYLAAVLDDLASFAMRSLARLQQISGLSILVSVLDAQWIDELSLKLLSRCARFSTSWPIAFALHCREGSKCVEYLRQREHLHPDLRWENIALADGSDLLAERDRWIEHRACNRRRDDPVIDQAVLVSEVYRALTVGAREQLLRLAHADEVIATEEFTQTVDSGEGSRLASVAASLAPRGFVAIHSSWRRIIRERFGVEGPGSRRGRPATGSPVNHDPALRASVTLEEGLQLYERFGDVQMAIRFYTERWAVSERYELAAKLGALHSAAGNVSLAECFYRRALSSCSQPPRIVSLLCQLAVLLGRTPGRIADAWLMLDTGKAERDKITGFEESRVAIAKLCNASSFLHYISGDMERAGVELKHLDSLYSSSIQSTELAEAVFRVRRNYAKILQASGQRWEAVANAYDRCLHLCGLLPQPRRMQHECQAILLKASASMKAGHCERAGADFASLLTMPLTSLRMSVPSLCVYVCSLSAELEQTQMVREWSGRLLHFYLQAGRCREAALIENRRNRLPGPRIQPESISVKMQK